MLRFMTDGSYCFFLFFFFFSTDQPNLPIFYPRW